jgi:hypothetical protein
VARLRFTDLDLFALLDADTDEARTFTTYLGYWVSLAEHIQENYGDDVPAGMLAALQRRRSFVRIGNQPKPTGAIASETRSLLLNGWTSELRLHLIEAVDTGRLWLANHGAPVDSYYATSRHASAFLVMHNGAVPTTHRGLLNAISALVTGPRQLPPPWDLHCLAVHPRPAYGGFPVPPGPCTNLARTADRDARVAMLLRTTRERGVREQVEKTKQRLKRRRAPNGEYEKRDRLLDATTVFDFAWRMRTRSNYGDPAMFYVGTLHEGRSRAYAEAIRAWNTATMFLFEALIAQRAKAVLEEAAVHFISRDRSGLADQLIVPRLLALGLLTQGDGHRADS